MNPSPLPLLSHVSVGTDDLPRAKRFYDAVLTTLGCRLLEESSAFVAYGRRYPELWVHVPIDGRPATPGNGSHVAFAASSRSSVDAFYEAALAAGGVDEGGPGGRPAYGEPYYGCYVRDPDGNKVEAVFWDAPF